MMSADSQSPELIPAPDRLPTLAELGRDLLYVSPFRRILTISLPFIIMFGYIIFAVLGLWLLALLSVMTLCFVTYGSSSHDLVHQTLGLHKRWNYFWLSLIELLSFRSGTAYRLSHIHHHQHLLEESDIEGAAAHLTLPRTVLSGPTLQFRLWLWSLSKFPQHRWALLAEGLGIGMLLSAAAFSVQWTWVPLIYAALVVAGSWIFPLITVYIPHLADGKTPLTQTRLFRGWWFRLIAMDHLYHLEHHLYPAVPHHHWRSLAVRLDPWFAQHGIQVSGQLGKTEVEAIASDRRRTQ